MAPLLYIFGGLPGTGKSTLASSLARRTQAVYLRIDSIEQTLRDAGFPVDGPIGYLIGYRLALDNLRGGVSAIADCVNPINLTREAWRDIARQAQVPFVEIEIICSDRAEHRQRIESRSTDIPGLKLPVWKDVLQREYHSWNTERIVLDTAGQSPDRSFSLLLELLFIFNYGSNPTHLKNNF